MNVSAKTWDEAVEYCEEEGGYLAEVLNDETQRFLVEQASVLNTSTSWWLGATDQEWVSFSILIHIMSMARAKQIKSKTSSRKISQTYN